MLANRLRLTEGTRLAEGLPHRRGLSRLGTLGLWLLHLPHGTRAVDEVRRDDHGLHVTLHILVDDRTEDDIDLRRRMLIDIARSRIDIVEAELGIACEVEDEATGILDILVQQRTADCTLQRLQRAIVAAAEAKHRIAAAALAEHRRDVGEIDVDDTRREDELRDAADGLTQYHVHGLEGRDQRHMAVLRQTHDVVILHGNQRIHG